MNTRRRTQSNVSRWLPVGAAGGLLAAVVVAGVVSGGGGGGSAAEQPLPSSSAPAPVVDDSTTTTAYAAVEADVSAEPIDKVPLGRTLSQGLAGDDVKRVQGRLKELGFDPGPIDGIYGTMTKQSVWAFEKLVMKVPRTEATGQVTAAMWDYMQEPIKIQPRRPTSGLANHTEVYLPEQVLVVFHRDEAVLVTHISTGELDENGQPVYYCEDATYDEIDGVLLDEPVTKRVCAYAKTPGGVFTYKRMVDGKRTSPLGGMMNPVYFNYGIAVHGADNVPNKPASHGCVRIPQHISDYFQTLVAKGERILVWNGEKEPEAVTRNESLPSFDAVQTTTTTSTTTTSTLAPPTTTVPRTTAPTAPATTVATTTTTTTLPPTTTTSSLPPVVPPADDL